MESYKEVNRIVYGKHAGQFKEFTKDYLEYILEDANLFLDSLNGKKILDLGSGPGRDSLFFKESCFNPVCLDISKEMIKLCRKKSLAAVVGDLENLCFKDNSFNGVWAYTSLLHSPKEKFNYNLSQVIRSLKSGGVFYLGMKEGNFEGFLESDKYPGIKRFFSLYRDEELSEILSQYFEIFHKSRVKLEKATFLNYLCRPKK
ncbi:class I SAM-dependent methyltransferase [Candidatus Woesearchaeota archaeon]|nr:class I SAM-dependent methyltransferase [Candidatus Woesearchaeota archaeon]